LSTFKELGLSDEVLKVLPELGFENPTDIQIQAIPKLLKGNPDFIGQAETGTGKTAAFGIPLLERIDTSLPFTQALVLAPTRELGQQIAEQLYIFSKYQKKINVLAVYGGASIQGQLKALRKTQHVIIATPGRLIDLIKRRAIFLDKLQILVLDEADEMLNMGFKEELDKILSYTPDEKMTWLFSATMPDFIKKIVRKHMDNPEEVKVNKNKIVNINISHQYVLVKQTDKTEALTRFLEFEPKMRGLVFCRTKRDTQSLAEDLMKRNYKADALHGDLSQRQRDQVMRRFKAHELQVLIATDVAARGIDVTDISHVFHYSLPDDMSYYTHRSGRTARAGKKGISVCFINSREKHKINRIIKQLKISFEHALIPRRDDISDLHIQNWCVEILNKKTNGKIDEELLAKAKMLFGNLSKEELITKVLVLELDKFTQSSSKDLNLTPDKDIEDRPSSRRSKRSSHNRNPRSGRKKHRGQRKSRRYSS
jgi:ATP-dependent RNA helicase DeaD